MCLTVCSPLINAALLFHLVSDDVLRITVKPSSSLPTHPTHTHTHTLTYIFPQACEWRPAAYVLLLPLFFRQSPCSDVLAACGSHTVWGVCVQVGWVWALCLVLSFPLLKHTHTHACTVPTRMHCCLSKSSSSARELPASVTVSLRESQKLMVMLQNEPVCSG